MDKKEMLAFIKENPMGYLGTVEDNKARVRGMETFRVDEKGLIFYTGKIKNVFKQIAKNPEVEVCYFAKGTQVRVRGKMEILEDLALKKEIVEKRPFLKAVHEKSYDSLAVLRLKPVQASTWSVQNITGGTTPVDL